VVTDLRLTAAICTNRSPDAVAPTLAAVAEQARGGLAEVLVVTSGLDRDAHAAHVSAADRVGARAVPSDRPGAAIARNRALDEVGDAGVIAYLDDDVLPAIDWLERLAARWREAPADVACIGGPILPRWDGAPPAWMSKRVWEAFSLLDLGPGVVEIHPGSDVDVWCSNASFRAGPLREVGGFAIAQGPWADLPMVGEESAAERALAARGLHVLYAGDVRVEHRVGLERLRLRELWRRQFYRGVSAGVDGRARVAPAAARALKASLGLGTALARGDRPLAAERLGRVAANAGAVLTPAVRRRLRRRGWPG
jgi:glycosyltransferase involved in cell wall biosynthesis